MEETRWFEKAKVSPPQTVLTTKVLPMLSPSEIQLQIDFMNGRNLFAWTETSKSTRMTVILGRTGPKTFMISFPALKITLLAVIVGTVAGAQASDTAFQQSFRLDVADSSGFSFATLTVPAGKRLIIRYLAVTSTLPSGQRFTSSVQATVQGATAEFAQAYLSQSNGDGTDELVNNQAVTIQADGDTTVYFQVFRRVPKGVIRVVFAVSGDLVPLPL